VLNAGHAVADANEGDTRAQRDCCSSQIVVELRRRRCTRSRRSARIAGASSADARPRISVNLTREWKPCAGPERWCSGEAPSGQVCQQDLLRVAGWRDHGCHAGPTNAADAAGIAGRAHHLARPPGVRCGCRLRHPIDPEEEDGYGSSWRRDWDGRRYYTREHLTRSQGPPDPGACEWAAEHDSHCIGGARLRVDPGQHCATYSVALFVAGLRGRGLGRRSPG
jgi:hypothetical protein